jgi:predicted metalloendopeptidase
LGQKAGPYLNGIQTLNENIADAFGLRATYNAHKKYSNDAHVLGYNHYNKDQTFSLYMSL